MSKVEANQQKTNNNNNETLHENDHPDDDIPTIPTNPAQDSSPPIAAKINEQIGKDPLSPTYTNPGQIPSIINALHEYFDTGISYSIQWRKNQLNGLMNILLKNEQHWVDAMNEDMGTHFFEARLMIKNIISEIKDTIDHFEKWLKPEKRSNPWSLTPGKTIVTPEPHGVVCDFIPYNYPMYLGFSTLIPILAAGNVCLFKPSSNTPACSALYQRLFPRFLDPKGIVVVCGPSSICDIILQQRFDFIFYTGSPRIGRSVMAAASKYLTPVILELGGKSPVYFDFDSNLQKCTKRLVWGKVFNGGQTCVAPDYCLVHTKIWDQLIQCIKSTVLQFYGEQKSANDNVTRIINKRHYERICNAIDSCHGEIIVNGFRNPEENYIGPTFIINPDLNSELMTDEIFGPVLPLIRVESAEDAVKFIRQREKPLACYVMTSNTKVKQLFTERTSSGALMFNDTVFHVSSSNSPFGGVGNSGMGQYHGDFGVRALSHLKPVINHDTTIDMEKRYPPYSEDHLNSLLKFL